MWRGEAAAVVAGPPRAFGAKLDIFLHTQWTKCVTAAAAATRDVRLYNFFVLLLWCRFLSLLYYF